MSVGIVRISKGLVQQAIEKVVNDHFLNERATQEGGGLRAQFLAKLQQDPSQDRNGDWITFLREKASLERSAEEYFRNRWLREFWSEYQTEAIVRQSLIKAIELANDPLVPIENHWIWTEGPSKFEVLLHVSPRQVTRIILTSPPDEKAPEGHIPTQPTSFWMIKGPDSYQKLPETSTFEKQMDEGAGWVVLQLLAPE